MNTELKPRTRWLCAGVLFAWLICASAIDAQSPIQNSNDFDSNGRYPLWQPEQQTPPSFAVLSKQEQQAIRECHGDAPVELPG